MLRSVRSKPTVTEKTLNTLPRLGGLFAVCNDRNRSSRSPWICGDNFRCLANHVIDHEARAKLYTWENVNAGQIVYVQTDALPAFFQCEDRISEPYVLVSHNSDLTPDQLVDYHTVVWPALQRGCLQAWFGLYMPEEWMENPTAMNRLERLPLGIAPRMWTLTEGFETYVCELLHQHQHQAPRRTDSKTALIDQRLPLIHKKHPPWQVFCCWNQANCPTARSEALRVLKDSKVAAVHSYGDFAAYLEQMSRYTFAASPRGNGPDCYRTWEAIALGVFPIVISNPNLDPLYQDLPVLIVPNWHSVTRQLLETELPRLMQIRQDQLNKATINRKEYSLYWEQRIHRKIRTFSSILPAARVVNVNVTDDARVKKTK